MTYKFWRESVIRILISHKHITKDRKVSEDIYLPYFKDGYSPVQAVKEDLGIDSINNYNNNYYD